MRMFAGPNGSGKSTLKSLLPPELQGIYINPDELEDQIPSWFKRAVPDKISPPSA